MRALSAVLACALLAAACGPASDSGPVAVTPESVTVGVHRIELVVPEGWRRYDQGRRQRFERTGPSQISLTDLGPVTPEGLRREIVRARDLFRVGQRADALTVLRGLHPRTVFPREDRWQRFSRPWHELRRVEDERTNAAIATIERAYAEVLGWIDSLSMPDLETMALAALTELGHDERRDIAQQRTTRIDDRDALVLDTWDRLNHSGRKRHLFVFNEDNLLVARMELGRFAEMQAAFDALVASLRFQPAGIS